MNSRRPAVISVCITLFLDSLGIGLIIPVAPKLIEHLQGKQDTDAAYVFGLLGSTYALMQFLFAPVLGSLSDHFGRRPVILFSLLGSGLDYFAMALSPNLWWLFITRAINGLTGANFGTATAYIADITPPEKRPGAFGMAGAAFGFGFIMGPVSGGYLGAHDLRLPFVVAGAVTMLNWLYALFVLPESLPLDRRRPFALHRSHPIAAFKHLARYPLVAGLAVVLFLVNLAQFALHATWTLYTMHRYQWSYEDVGNSLLLVGLSAAIMQGGLSRKLVPKIGEPRSLLFGLAVGVLAYAGYAFATHGWMIYTIIALASVGAIAQPATQSMITRTVHRDEQGEIQGSLTSLSAIAAILGPLIGAPLFGKFAAKGAPFYLPGAPFIASAILSLLGLVIAVVVLRRHAPPPPNQQASDGPIEAPNAG